MKLKRLSIFRVFLLVTATLLLPSAYGQTQVKLECEDEPSFEKLKSPDFSGTNPKKWDDKDWMEMEVEFEVTLTDPKDATFVDSLTVKWYVAAKNPDSSGGKWILLEKEVEHINIPVKEKLFSSVYLSPSAIMRLSGKDRAAENVIDRVGGEILFNGTRVGAFSSKDKPGWWQSGGLSRYEKIPLRSKNETPFHYFWWDRYAENKVERR